MQFVFGLHSNYPSKVQVLMGVQGNMEATKNTNIILRSI